MDYDRQAAVIANDLDSMLHRIESLQSHPSYTVAVEAVTRAKMAINAGRQAIHAADQARRHGVNGRFADTAA